ncbi:hypothetical protein [Pseudomonas frederiksbergensis]|uniref:Uncharacterized protein n=1 Tax=Pseudomonas frederiksbergensis TaxID=104087 RepID=A0A6L5BZN7_9PSED|nr:hypothetical protein [Pseudomonas frederiksbergensis]KAF2393770.1 hypothetical protein FX983_01740 [Pseudomonas frederiksbergensis]
MYTDQKVADAETHECPLLSLTDSLSRDQRPPDDPDTAGEDESGEPS